MSISAIFDFGSVSAVGISTILFLDEAGSIVDFAKLSFNFNFKSTPTEAELSLIFNSYTHPSTHPATQPATHPDK